MTPGTPSKNFGVSQLQPAVALLRIRSCEINGSEMNEKDGDEKCRTRTSIESVECQNIRQVMLPLSNEHEPKFAAKRTLFGKQFNIKRLYVLMRAREIFKTNVSKEVLTLNSRSILLHHRNQKTTVSLILRTAILLQ